MPAGAGDNAPVYKQTYTIVIKGDIRGKLKRSPRPSNAAGNILSSSDHEIFVTDGLGTKRMAFTTKMQLAKNTYTPISYSYKYTTGECGRFLRGRG